MQKKKKEIGAPFINALVKYQRGHGCKHRKKKGVACYTLDVKQYVILCSADLTCFLYFYLRITVPDFPSFLFAIAFIQSFPGLMKFAHYA